MYININVYIHIYVYIINILYVYILYIQIYFVAFGPIFCQLLFLFGNHTKVEGNL